MTEAKDTSLPHDQSWIADTGVTRRQALAGSVVAASYALAAQPLSATAISTPADGLDAGMVSFATGDIRMGAYRAKPRGKTNLPVIIVVQEIFGVHEWIRDITRRFAKAGYYAIAPDLYQRQGDATKIADFRQLYAEIVSKVPDAQVMGDLDALTRFVGSDGANAKRLGITGYCWGGRIVWLYAAHNPKVKAGVAWYGRVVGTAEDERGDGVQLEARPERDAPQQHAGGHRDQRRDFGSDPRKRRAVGFQSPVAGARCHTPACSRYGLPLTQTDPTDQLPNPGPWWTTGLLSSGTRLSRSTA